MSSYYIFSFLLRSLFFCTEKEEKAKQSNIKTFICWLLFACCGAGKK